MKPENWDNFLKDIAEEYDVKGKPKDVFCSRFAYENWQKGDKELLRLAKVPTIETYKKHATQIYKRFAKDQPNGCPEIDATDSSPGKFDDLKVWLKEIKYPKWLAQQNNVVDRVYTAADINWRDVCLSMLEHQKRLTTNQLMHDKDDRFELDEVHVPLALVERKKPDKHDGETSAEQGSRFYEPQYEEKQRFEHEQFLLDVLENGKGKSQGRRIAIIGQPGAGKTTLLSKIAFWVWKETEDLPILISLADLPEANPKQEFLEQYLLNKWLKMALPYISPNAVEVTEALKEKLIQLCNQGKVWLLLDGVDEMPTQGGSSHLSTIYSQLSGWVGQARVVLTCRLNVWEANPSLLPDNFETYRTLEFSYGDSRTADQVREFISKWFKGEPQLGGQLRQALDTPGKERIKDLVKNPLRLAMLCSTWNRWREHGGLPDTKAKLYKGYVDKFYEWKHGSCPTNERQRRELNKALGGLSKWAIDQPTSRFRIRLSQIPEALGDIFGYKDEEGSLLGFALKLGWLNDVGFAVENPDEEVYAFFHPTFQEYFAALAISDWHEFLNHVPENPAEGTYRIFEPQWKEVILLWLGRENIAEKQKNEFIKALIGFEDGCREGFFRYKGFYEYRAYFLAAAGITEFQECQRAEEIVKQIIKWGFGEFKVQFQARQMYVRSQIAEQAKAILSDTHCTLAATALINLIEASPDKYTRIEVAEILGKIKPGHPKAINTLVGIMHNSPNDGWHIQAIKGLGKIGKGNPKAITTLVNLIHMSPDDSITHNEAASSLSQIDPEHPEAIPMIEYSGLYFPIFQDLVRLGKIEPNKPEWIAALVAQLKSNPKDKREEFNRRWAVRHLIASDTSAPEVSAALIDLIRTNPDENTFQEAVMSLGRIGKRNPEAIDLLTELSCNCQNWVIRWRAIQGLRYADTSHEKVIWVLIELIRTSSDQRIRIEATQSLGQILQKYPLSSAVSVLKNTLLSLTDFNNDFERYQKCYDVLWHCAQHMNYPAFYQAWHSQPTSTDSDNQETPAVSSAPSIPNLDSAD